MKYYSDFIWEKNRRETNEDSLSINQFVINGQPLLLASVCDGIGGLTNGDLASSYLTNVIRSSTDYLKHSPIFSINAYLHYLKREIYRCHQFLKSKQTPLGTTLCLLILYNKRAYLINVGDSRLYKGKSRLSQVSTDHTDSKGRLTLAIGTGDFKRLVLKKYKLKKNMFFLLCSDGIYKKNDSIIKMNTFLSSIKSEQDLKQKLDFLYSNAINKGECDNASAIMIYVN